MTPAEIEAAAHAAAALPRRGATMNAAERFYAREAAYGRAAPRPPARVSADRARRVRELELLALSAPPSGELRVRAEGKHFWVLAYVNGAPVRMMFDPGATVTVLSAADARKAGIATDGATSTILAAAGTVRAATATIRTLRIGGADFHGLPAVVIARGGRDSLLGAEALGRFKSYGVKDGVLSLVW